MPDRVARVVELLSLAVIGGCMLLFGWTLLRNAAHFRLASSVLLVLLAALEIATLRRTWSAGGQAARLRVTRDAAFLLTIAFALVAVLSGQRWSFGACISSLEFALVLELLARLAPAATNEP